MGARVSQISATTRETTREVSNEMLCNRVAWTMMHRKRKRFKRRSLGTGNKSPVVSRSTWKPHNTIKTRLLLTEELHSTFSVDITKIFKKEDIHRYDKNTVILSNLNGTSLTVDWSYFYFEGVRRMFSMLLLAIDLCIYRTTALLWSQGGTAMSH